MRRLLVVAVVLLLVGAPASARADDGRVELSLDGSTWSSSLDTSVLTDAPTTWVPGDVASGRLWVRNDGPTAAALSVAAAGLEDDVLMDDLQVTVRSGEAVASVRGTGTTTDDLGVLEPGQRVRLAVEVGLVPSSRNRTQTEREDVRLRVVLTEVVASGSGQLGPGGQASAGGSTAAGASGWMDGSSDATAPLTGGSGGDLPGTGAPVADWFVWVGALALGSGAALVLARRRDVT